MEDKISSRETSRSAWNINGQYSQIIVRRLAMSQGLYDRGEYPKYFNVLHSIFRLTTHNLKDEEIKVMNDLRMDVLRKQKYFKKCTNDDGTETILTNEDRKGKWHYVENIAIYQAALLKVLKKCGFLTNQSNRARLDF